ncbi:MAG: 6-phosphofructokinase [Nitrospirae bacterium]|nr:6-phosphofructokinase [Nitrospirota bacterium]
MRKIAVLTSGGDAPGMNAAIRAVTRTGLAAGLEIFGVRSGYSGLMAGDFIPLGTRDVGGIIERGGTILGSVRVQAFETEEGRRRGLAQLQAREIDALIVIGGNGSQTGAYLLSQLGFPVVGVASTIDNDLVGSDITIGVDTAMNTALEAIDRIKTTASSHHRAFLVEVMGRDCGYLALMVGIAGGAEVIAIPEAPCEPEEIARELRAAYDRGKGFAIAVIAEGMPYKAADIAAYFKEHRERIGFSLRVTCLGHIQRGGSPTAFDRLLATRMGASAVETLMHGKEGVLIGLLNGEMTMTPLREVAHLKKQVDLRLLALARTLAQ